MAVVLCSLGAESGVLRAHVVMVLRPRGAAIPDCSGNPKPRERQVDLFFFDCHRQGLADGLQLQL